MTRKPVLVVAALLGALVALVAVGQRVLDRDRRAMYERYAHERLLGVEEAADGFARDVIEIGEDLELAATLLQDAESIDVAERELHAIATIKREYLVMDARSDTGTTTRVVALDAPRGVAASAAAELADVLEKAVRAPGRLHQRNVGPWLRVFARRPAAHEPAVAVVVDMALVLGRLKVQRDRGTKVAILTRDGHATSRSDPALVALVRERPAVFASMLDAARADRPSTRAIPGDVAAAIELPATTGVAMAVPLRVGSDTPWTLLVISSTTALERQEQTLVRRLAVGGVLVLLLLLSSAVYVIRTTRRTAVMRERLRHVDRLAHLTEKAQKILDHIPSGVLALSEARCITGANRWFIDRVGDLSGSDLSEAFARAPAADVKILWTLVDRAFATRKPQSRPRVRTRLLGDEALLSIHVVPLERSIADVSMLIVFDDLTQLRRIEERLLHSEKLVTAGQLAAGIAHEIGTPLGVARGRVELTLSRLGANHAEAANHQVVIEQIDRVTRLIQQLLDYVRPVAAAIQHLEVAKIVHSVADLLAAHAAKRDVALAIDGADNLPGLRADPDQLQQVLVNLVLNAIDACDRGGHVTLRVRAGDEVIVFEVIDDGHGVPHEIQSQIFDPFFTTKKRGRGTGLGLWVVAQLVRAHSAEIELVSTPGAGTTIRVTWPVGT